VPLLVELVRPTSVVDLGCGTGAWLETFLHAGISEGEVLGVEGPWLDPAALRFPRARLRVHDLREPLVLERSFDLALSLEVAEHLPAQSAAALVQTLTSCAPVVVFSAAAPYQGGTGHLNEQWPQHWAELFARHDFVAIDALRPRIWLNGAIAWYYRQNMAVFVSRSRLADHPALASAFREGQPLLPLVHPDRYVRVARGSVLLIKDKLVEHLYARWPAARNLIRARPWWSRHRGPDA
jgi:SAM-dependent methyltransferase